MDATTNSGPNSAGMHPDPAQIAAYLERRVPKTTRAELENHFAGCAECRAELVELAPIIGRRRHVPVIVTSGILAAAALLVFVSVPRRPIELGEPSAHRGIDAGAVAPRLISPFGTADDLRRFTWTAVPGADQYRVTVFDGEGTVLQELTTTDTTVLLSSLPTPTSRSIHWRVGARIEWDRWVTSELASVTIRGP